MEGIAELVLVPMVRYAKAFDNDCAHSDASMRGLNMHMGYNARSHVPEWMGISSANVSDLAVARRRAISSGTTYSVD